MTILSKLNLSDKTKVPMLASPQTFTYALGC